MHLKSCCRSSGLQAEARGSHSQGVCVTQAWYPQGRLLISLVQQIPILCVKYTVRSSPKCSEKQNSFHMHLNNNAKLSHIFFIL